MGRNANEWISEGRDLTRSTRLYSIAALVAVLALAATSALLSHGTFAANEPARPSPACEQDSKAGKADETAESHTDTDGGGDCRNDASATCDRGTIGVDGGNESDGGTSDSDSVSEDCTSDPLSAECVHDATQSDETETPSDVDIDGENCSIETSSEACEQQAGGIDEVAQSGGSPIDAHGVNEDCGPP